jgi:cytochrome c553
MTSSPASLTCVALLCGALVIPCMATPNDKRGKSAAAAPIALPTSPLQSSQFGDPVAGKQKADAERCMECHGPEGQGAGHSNGAEGKFPKLAGQRRDYLAKQLLNFRTGERKHDKMNMMARSVSEDDLLDIVAYYSSQSRMQGDGQGDNPVGRELFAQGDAERDIAACVNCHGDGAARVDLPAGTPVPELRGQAWRYLEQQLLDWRSGWRRNSAGGVMNRTTRALTDGEIVALASYLSGLR